MDNSNFIQNIREHISLGIQNAHTRDFLVNVRKAIDEKNASPEQQAQLELLKNELEKLTPRSNQAFLGASATDGGCKICY